MVLKLPFAAAGSVTEAGRRARTARLPDAGDVPTVRVASDPGLQVPDLAQFAGGAEDIGAAVTDAGVRLNAANERIITRKEGIARDRDDINYFDQLNEAFRDLQENADFAVEQTIIDAGNQAEAIKQQILQDHAGGELSKAQLANQLDRRLATFTDVLAGENISAGNQQITASVDARTDGIVADMVNDPAVPIEQRFGQLDDALDFLGLTGSRADAARAAGQEKIATARFNQVIARADIDDNGLMIEVRALLENPALREALPSTVRSGFANRVFEIENTIQRVGIEARVQVASLEAVADSLGLEGEAKQDFIISLMTGGRASVSDKRAALDRLVAGGVIDQEISDKIGGGVLKMAQIRNVAGDLENVLVDLSQFGGEGGVTPIAEAGAPAAAAAPAAEPAAVAEPAAPVVEPAAPAPAVAAAPEIPAEEKSIFEIVAGDTAVTGFGPSIAEGLQGITGQFGVDVASAELLLFRDRINNNIIPLIDSLVPSTRFPVAQIKLIREMADIETGAGTDRRSLLTSIVALDETLVQMQRQAEDDARDPLLSSDVKKAQAENAAKLRNFRATLGVPDGFSAADIEALGEPQEGNIQGFINEIGKAISEFGAEDGAGAEAQLPEVSTQEEVDALEPGTEFIWAPTGQIGRKD